MSIPFPLRVTRYRVGAVLKLAQTFLLLLKQPDSDKELLLVGGAFSRCITAWIYSTELNGGRGDPLYFLITSFDFINI